MTDLAPRARHANQELSAGQTRRAAFAVLVVVIGIAVVAAMVADAMMALPRADWAIRQYHADLQARALAKSAWRAARNRAPTGAQPNVTTWALQPGELPNQAWSATVSVALQGDGQRAQWVIDVVLREREETICRFQTSFPDTPPARPTGYSGNPATETASS